MTNSAGGFQAALALRGPGQLGSEGAAGVMIFDAGGGGRGFDPIARFYDEEAAGLDWLEDYLRDHGTSRLVRDLIEPEDFNDEFEEIYQKDMANGTETDSGVFDS